MRCSGMCGTVAAIGVLGSACATLADVTADDVWTDVQTFLITYGYEINVTEHTVSNGLVLRDFVIVNNVPDTDVDIHIGLPDLALIEVEDGSVQILTPEAVEIMLDATYAEGMRSIVRVAVNQPGSAMRVSGDPAALTYEYLADAVSIDVIEVAGDDVAVAPDTGLELQSVASVFLSRPGDPHFYERKISADSATYNVEFSSPADDISIKLSGQIDDIASTSSREFLSGVNLSTAPADILLNMNATGRMTYGSGMSVIDFVDGLLGHTIVIETRSNGGVINTNFTPRGLRYDIKYTDASIQVSGVPDLPDPVSLAVADAGALVQFPVVPSDEAQDFALGLRLQGAGMSDSLWDMFDADKILPRDPADLILDLSGAATVLADFLALDTDPGSLSATPVEFNSLDINELLLSFAGARLTGQGAFDFVGGDTPLAPGPGAPRGQIDLELVGGNGLLDGLVVLGFLPQQSAMMARGMMGMLAIPGDAPDTLTSTLEINDQGHVLANGQRIQ